jgi:two-component system, LytTR family, sensor kinase
MPAAAPPAPDSTDPARTSLWWGMFFGSWTVLALFFALQARMAASLRGGTRAWSEALAFGALDAYSWGVLALAAFWMARRFPLDGGGWRRAAAAHIGALLVLIPARLHLLTLIGPLLLSTPRPSQLTSLDRVVIAFPTNLQVYLLLIGVGYTLEYFRRYRDRELAAAQLEAQVANAHLQVLTTQLQPRFLFAALRTISALMHRDVGAADRTLALLGDLLRGTLQKAACQSVSLREEIEFLELYLEIERMRFGDRLHLFWDVEPEVMDASVPHLVVQPLVDSLIRHGITVRSGPGAIEVRVYREGDQLTLEVCERRVALIPDRKAECTSTAWASQHPAGPEALELPKDFEPDGLANLDFAITRARLSQLYGERHRFGIEMLPRGGMLVRLSIPLTFEAVEAAIPAGPALAATAS